MTRRFGRKRPDRDIARGVSQALQEAFAKIEQDEDDAMRRLIAQMQDFEGSRK